MSSSFPGTFVCIFKKDLRLPSIIMCRVNSGTHVKQHLLQLIKMQGLYWRHQKEGESVFFWLQPRSYKNRKNVLRKKKIKLLKQTCFRRDMLIDLLRIYVGFLFSKDYFHFAFSGLKRVPGGSVLAEWGWEFLSISLFFFLNVWLFSEDRCLWQHHFANSEL